MPPGNWNIFSPNARVKPEAANPWSLREPPADYLPDHPVWFDRSKMRPWHVLVAVPLVAAGGVAGVMTLGAGIPTLISALSGALPGLYIASIPILRSIASDTRKELGKARFQLCPHCGYDLSRRPRKQDRCPECGKLAPRREVLRYWVHYLHKQFKRAEGT